MTLTERPGDSAALFDFEDVTVSAAGNSIIDGVSWRVNSGEHWVVVGPNGAGKTTLARVLAGRAVVHSGSVSILGADSKEHSSADLASQVGLASVEVALAVPPHEKVIDVVLSSAWGQTVTFGEEYEDLDRRRGVDLLAALGVAELSERTFSSLSEGERRRVLLARALMSDPELLILDEPTAGLDLRGREILVTALTEIMNAPTSPAVVLITHELEEVGEGFTHALLLAEGKVQGAGPLEEMFTSERLSALFGLDLQVNRVNGRWMATSVRE